MRRIRQSTLRIAGDGRQSFTTRLENELTDGTGEVLGMSSTLELVELGAQSELVAEASL